MRVFIGILLISVLSACGGSSGTDETGPTKSNTAPVLTGQLNMQLTVASTGSVNFALLDAENDPTTVSYVNKPEWVEGSVSNNQLQLTATPGFFNVGTHQFILRVSDGKLHSDYTVTLNVSDDPTKWIEIATPKVEFIGQWALDNGDDLHLYANGDGRYLAADGEVFNLNWYSRDGYIEISSSQVNCVNDDCSEYFEVYVVATEGARKRLVLESDAQVLAVTVVPYESKPLQYGFYSPNHLAVDYIQSINETAVDLYVPFEFALPSTIVSSWAPVKTVLTTQDKLQQKENIYTTTINLSRYATGERINVELSVNFVSGVILPSAGGRLTLEYQLAFFLLDDTLDPQDFHGLTETLAKPYIGHLELGYNEQLDVPQFAFNSAYFSGFRLKPDFDQHNMMFGGTEVLFTDNGKGVVRFSIPQLFSQTEREFSWVVDGQQLVITLAGAEYRYSFIQHPVNGLSLIADDLYYPFLRSEQEYSAEALTGNFLLEQYSKNNASYHNIFANNTAGLYSSYLDRDDSGFGYYKWQQEHDGSITFLYSAMCYTEQSFEECAADLEQQLAHGSNVTVNYRNFKVIKQTERDTYIQFSMDYRNAVYNQSYQSVSRLINVPQQ